MKKLFVLLFAIGFMSCAGDKQGAQGNGTDTIGAENNNAPTGRFKAGDQLSVLAKSGIVLREKPDPNGNKLSTIAYGQKVSVVNGNGATFKVEVCKGFDINGNWIKVTAAGKEGYVFDGFLSKLDAPKSDPFETIMKGAKSTAKSSSNPSETDKSSYVWFKEVETFDNGASYETQAYEGGGKMVQRFPSTLITIEEAYLCLNATDKTKGKWSFNTQTGHLEFNSDDEMSGVYIYKEGANVVVDSQTAD